MATNESLFAAEDERMAREARGQAAPLSNAKLFAAEDARLAEPALRANVAVAAGTNADEFAAQRKAAQAAGVPKMLGPAMPEDTARWASVETVARDTAGAPTLRHRYTDEDFARLAHDDSGPLSQIERAVGQAVRYVMGAAPGGGLPGDVVAGARAIASAGPNFGAGAYGIAAAPFGVADQAIQALDNAAAWMTGTPRRQLAPGMESFLLGLSRDASATAKATMGLPDDASLLRRGVMSGLQSGAQSLALLPLGLARGSADLMLGAMGAVTGGLSYLKGREKGLAPLQAAAYGAEDAVAEVVTERYLGAAGLLKLIKAGSSAGKLFAYEVLKEVPGEIGATLWQNFNEWQNVNPDKSVSDFVAEQPEAVAETIIATLVGGGGQIGVVKGLERALGVTERRQIEAVAAEQRAAMMGELAKLAEASKLRERSPEDFQAFAQDVAANNVPALYFDARALLESGVDLDALARTMPSVAPQAEQALATGGDIIIPSGEFLTAAPGQAFLDSLVQNARTAPEAMSAAEAKDWMAERGDALKAQVDKAMAEREADAGFAAGMQAVQTKIAEQLDADPRFTKDVNQRFATLAASYYATMAERMGTTAEKLWEKYPLAVTSKAMSGEALEQRNAQIETPEFKAWFGDSKVVDSEGLPLVVYHGAPDTRFVQEDGTFKSHKERLGFVETDPERAFFFSSDRRVAATYADDRRAFDYQNAEPGVVDTYLTIKNPMVIDHAGKHWHGTRDAVEKAKAAGHDGVIIKNVVDDYTTSRKSKPTDVYAVFRPEQIKSATGNSGAFDPSNPNILLQSGVKESRAEAFSRWSNEATLITSVEAMAHEFKTGESFVAEAFHGTARPDRVGVRFRKARATSGPMSFFSSNPEVSSNYATGKQDTSIGGEELAYEHWFKVKFKGDRSATSIDRAWYRLTLEQKERIAQLAPRVWTQDDLIELGPETNKSGVGSYDLELERTRRNYDGRGNPLRALVEIWLNGGVLFDDEQRFLDVLKLAGWPSELAVDFDPPNATYPAVYKVFVKMGNPLVTDDIPQPVLDALGAAAKRDRSRAQNGGAWDKNTRTLREWVAALSGERSEFVWTSIPDKVTDVFKGLGYDGIVDVGGKSGGTRHKVYIPFEETQVKSATGNRGTFDASSNILKQGADELRRGSFDPATNTIALLKDADLSTFLHESGHFFLAMHANLAAQVQAEMAAFGEVSAAEQQLLDDMNTLLAWFGVQPSDPGRTALDEWQSMTLDEQREHHEKFARGFEAYLFTGKAPSMQLESLFQRFRAWLTSVYKQVKALGVELTPEVRSVMDRMLATDEQIRNAEAAASMGMIFATPEEAAKFGVDWTAYHAQGEGATQDAITALGARSLKDMQWLERAKGRELRKLQKQAAALRREAKMDARARVMAEPVYRAWAFLTGKGEAQDRAELPDQPAPEADSLFKAIALFGGLNRESATRDLGVHQDDYRASSGIFGKPVFRKDGGMSADAMAEALAEAGYLALDEDGRHDLAELEERIAAELGGKLQYPIGHDYGQAPLPALPEHATFGKLSTEALRERFGTGEDALWRKLSALGMTSDAVGIDPDVVGEAFGFDSGNALVRAIAAAPSPAEAIEAATDRLMLERHGDITSPEALERAAQAAIHNEARARFVAAELDALQAATEAKRDAGTTRAGRTRRVAILPEAARRFAAETISRLKLRDLLPARYEAAAARAGRAAEKALRKDDIATSAREKRNQLINIHAAKEAHAAQDEVKRALSYFKRLDTPTARKRLTADYADQIDALLAQYDLRQRSLKDIDKQLAFAEWVQAQRDQGIELDIDTQGMMAKPYKEMTVEELRGLVDAVRQIEHLGRTKGRLLLAKGRREYEAVRDAMVASIAANAHGRTATARSATTNLGRAWEKVKAFGAAHIKAGQWARIMDGGQDGGAVWEGLIRPANEQANLETEMRAEATERLSEIMQPVRKAGRMGGKGTFFPSIGRSLNREAVFVMALNMGNEGNIQRLLGGGGWTVQQIQPVLATLTAADWRAVQQVWDFMGSYRPLIAALERRVLGREPKWVEPRPLTVTGSDGETVNLRGGYYPIVYDPRASVRAEENADAEGAKALLKGAHGAATTRRSFTKQRVESVTGRPLMYTLQGMYGGVNDVIHDLAWREWLIDTNRLLRSKTLDAAIRGTYGPEVVRQFKSWRDDVAIGDRGAQSAMDAATNWLRQSVSISGLGFNVMSAALQPLGITGSISRIGAKWVGVGLKQYMAAPLRMTKEVSERSSFMANRQRTRFRELNELRNQIQGGPAANLNEDAGKYAYWLMMRAQQMVDVPTWLGAYEKAVAAGNDEARAVQLADQAVIDSQGAGHMHSQSAIERGPALQRLFTVFYSFMNTTLNMLVMKGMTNHSAARTAVDFLLLAAAPAVLASLLRDALTPGDAGDDDDWQAMAKKLAGEQLTFLFGLVVLGREFAEAGRTMAGLGEQPRDYAGPAGLRSVSDAARLAQQANQGEFDDAMRKALVNVSGSWFGLPAAQINRTITGAKALSEGDTRNPAALVFGYQEPR